MAFGSQPYQESSLRSALRLAAAGLGSVPRGANFGTAFAAAAGGASRAYSAAQQAAQEYAMKQQVMEEERAYRAHNAAYMDALAKKAGEPPKPVEPYAKAPWWADPKYKDSPEAKAAAAKATHISTGKGAATPKPAKIPRRIPVGKNKPVEQDWINSIMQETDPDALSRYVTGRGAADSEAIRRAAQIRVGELMRQMR